MSILKHGTKTEGNAGRSGGGEGFVGVQEMQRSSAAENQKPGQIGFSANVMGGSPRLDCLPC